MTTVTVAEISGQFSDTPQNHQHDAQAQFGFFKKHGVWAAMGTEAGGFQDNHDYRDALIEEAISHDFFIFASPNGEWAALNREFMHSFGHGFSGPFIPRTHGLKASEGAHAPRGIAWAAGYAEGKNLGCLTFGALHALTQRSIEATGVNNDKLWEGAGHWGRMHGRGSGCVWLAGDANENDMRHDIFHGEPFTTVADEIGKHPGTHGRNKRVGNPIDFIGTFDEDHRVKAKNYRVFDDSDLKLYSDHFLQVVDCEVDVRE